MADALHLSEPERKELVEAARGGLPETAVQARASQGGGPAGADGRELAELRRESRRLREAVEILKRAVAIAAAATPAHYRSGMGTGQTPVSEGNMHTFPEYAPLRDAQVAELVRRNPFAAVISTDHGVPIATHVPVITPPSEQIHAGDVLWGHMARANPQWQTFDPARPVLLTFTSAVPELLRLLRDTSIPPHRRDRPHRRHWSTWRRRHQHRARQAHQRWHACAETAP